MDTSRNQQAIKRNDPTSTETRHGEIFLRRVFRGVLSVQGQTKPASEVERSRVFYVLSKTITRKDIICQKSKSGFSNQILYQNLVFLFEMTSQKH